MASLLYRDSLIWPVRKVAGAKCLPRVSAVNSTKIHANPSVVEGGQRRGQTTAIDSNNIHAPDTLRSPSSPSPATSSNPCPFAGFFEVVAHFSYAMRSDFRSV
jgi:hypothetical protein